MAYTIRILPETASLCQLPDRLSRTARTRQTLPVLSGAVMGFQSVISKLSGVGGSERLTESGQGMPQQTLRVYLITIIDDTISAPTTRARPRFELAFKSLPGFVNGS
jgi:hypothetical protein